MSWGGSATPDVAAQGAAGQGIRVKQVGLRRDSRALGMGHVGVYWPPRIP